MPITETYDKVWWITGFNPCYQDVEASDLKAVYTIDMSEHKDLYEAFINSEAYAKNKSKWSVSPDNKYLLTLTF